MTKHKRRKIKKKTRKFYGGKTFEKSEGIMDIIGDKLTNYSKNTSKYLTEKGLRLARLEPISDDKTTPNTDSLKIADKIEQVNNVLDSSTVNNSINKSLEETAIIGEKILKNVNEKLSSPEIKKETKEVLNNVADYAEITLDALNDPLDKAIDSLNNAGTKAVSGVLSGAIKVGTDVLAAVPGLGTIIEFGKIINDTSAAVGDVVEAGTEATSTVSKLVDESSKNIKNTLDERKQHLNKFKDSKKITGRINKSIDDFKNPFPSTGGSIKTKSKYSKNMFKTKRVRFSL